MLGRVGALVILVAALSCAIASADPLAVTQQAKLLASDGTAGDWFGETVSISGDTAVIGASLKNHESGAAYAFVRSGTTWTQQASFLAGDGASWDWFGSSVSVSGNTVVVGASQMMSGNGAAYVFVGSGATWVQEAKLIASDGARGDRFGCSVSVSGDTAVVGASYHDPEAGAGYVFVRNGTNWSQQARLNGVDEFYYGLFGSSVSVSGDTAVFGAPQKDSWTGAAYVFVRSGTTWSEQTRLLASDGAEGHAFGFSVSVSGDIVVVGASGNSAAYVFVRSGTSWSQQDKLVASDTTSTYFGSPVSVSGDMAIVGAFENSGTGSAYVFVRNGSTWSAGAKVLASDGAANDHFGSSVSIAGDTAVVGAPEVSTSFTGAAYVFVVTHPNGDPCTTSTECESGICTDGVCCNEVCDTPCLSCQLSDHMGTCQPVPCDGGAAQEDGGAARHGGGAARHEGGGARHDGGVAGLRSRGCSCEVGSRATNLAGGVSLLLAVALAWRPRRRSRGTRGLRGGARDPRLPQTPIKTTVACAVKSTSGSGVPQAHPHRWFPLPTSDGNRAVGQVSSNILLHLQCRV
jgi:hypothetical protein